MCALLVVARWQRPRVMRMVDFVELGGFVGSPSVRRTLVGAGWAHPSFCIVCFWPPHEVAPIARIQVTMPWRRCLASQVSKLCFWPLP